MEAKLRLTAEPVGAGLGDILSEGELMMGPRYEIVPALTDCAAVLLPMVTVTARFKYSHLGSVHWNREPPAVKEEATKEQE